MTQSTAITNLVCNIEKIIGSECYNPRSTDGRTGEVGKWFRYPVHYSNKFGVDIKTWSTIYGIDGSQIDDIYYQFGTNELYIGSAIVKVLEYLEKKYNIDFDELTKNK